MQQTSPAWWLHMLDAMHARIRECVATKNDTAPGFHSLVKDAWELGLFISMGFRGEEACRLELGKHLLAGETRVFLNAHERKNVKPQTAHIQERYLPADIHHLYMQRTRQWYVRGQYEAQADHRTAFARATKRPAAAERRLAHAKKALGRIQTHQFLIVMENGAAPGSRTTARKFEIAVASHGSRWKAAMMKRAIESGLTLPESLDYEFGRHCIRTVFGYALFQTQGLIAAANYLGDKLGTVETAYSAVDGVHVDVSTVAGFEVPDRQIQADTDDVQVAPRAAALAPQYLLKLEELRNDLRASVITRAEYDAYKEDLLSSSAVSTARLCKRAA